MSGRPIDYTGQGAEFAQAFDGVAEADRRSLLKLMGASLALAGLAGCSGEPDPNARPYVNTPDGETLGEARYYASAVTFGGYAQPVLAKTREGRPVKLDGLPDHPASRGGADAFTQAALLGLYDAGRSRTPRMRGQPVDWAAFDTAMVENARRLDTAGGEGFRLLTRATSSPTFARQWAELQKRWPKARWHVCEAVSEDLRREAIRLAFGREADLALRLDRAQVVVSLDDDLLGPGPRQTLHSRDWSARRKAFQAGDGAARLFVAEPTPSLTGAMAGERLVAGVHEMPAVVGALAAAVAGAPGLPGPREAQAAWVAKAAAAIRAAPGAALVTAGPWLPVEVQTAAFGLSRAIGAVGKTLDLIAPVLLAAPDNAASLGALVEDLKAGRVDTLAILDANPVYTAGGLGFAEAMAKARLTVHAGLHADETAAAATWHAPVQHDLETWADARAADGRPSLIQPLVKPLHGARARSVLMENLQGHLGGDERLILAQTWKARFPDEAAWSAAVARGFVDEPAESVAAGGGGATVAAPAPPSGLTALVRPDPTVWDGSLADNPWLQELPKPFSKATWDNAVGISPALARAQGLANGDRVRLAVGGRAVEGPVWIAPGQHADTVVVRLGYGRRVKGQISEGRGHDAFALAPGPATLSGATLTRLSGRQTVATTQPQTDLDGFDFVRTRPRATTRLAPPKAEQPSFYDPPKGDSPQWGMAIDTDLCTGCNACVTACMAENNTAVVGPDQIAKGRQMHWLRIDHYHAGPVDDPKLYNQPVPCMHCEQAPCEMGCPVAAAVHSHDGLNLQVYNRCIGTRTCSSFCPYKVRRFNWFDYTKADPPEFQAARNPEVTVRGRGVMEKCTYCIQRISAARRDAKVAGRPLKDGDVVTACQQTCPTEAIVFGDVSDPNSAVSRLKAQQRNYALLEEAGTRPRTTYLARLADEDEHG